MKPRQPLPMGKTVLIPEGVARKMRDLLTLSLWRVFLFPKAISVHMTLYNEETKINIKDKGRIHISVEMLRVPMSWDCLEGYSFRGGVFIG